MTSDRVELAPLARADLDDLVEHVEARNPVAARAMLARVAASLATLAAPSPRTDGPAVTLRTGESCRRHFVYPVAIYYRRTPGVVEVVRIYHHAREPIAR